MKGICLAQGFSTFFFSSVSTIVVSLCASEHRHQMSVRTSTVYKYVKGVLSDIKRAPWWSSFFRLHKGVTFY
jgi:hypothetical protein